MEGPCASQQLPPSPSSPSCWGKKGGGGQKSNNAPPSPKQGKILKPDLGALDPRQGTTEGTASSLKHCVLVNSLRFSLHQTKSQTPRPVAPTGLRTCMSLNPGQTASRQLAILPEEEVFADTAPTCPQERKKKKKIGVLSTSDPKFRIRVLVCFNAFGRGEWFQ